MFSMNSKGVPAKGLIWIGFILIGGVGGMLLGSYVVGENVTDRGDPASYADRTGNPHAPGVPPAAIEPCHDCAGSYGRGVRHNSGRDTRMDDAFRELGAVEGDDPSDPEPDYRYGGNFDDVDAARTIVMQSPVPTIGPLEDSETELVEPSMDPPPTVETITKPQRD